MVHLSARGRITPVRLKDETCSEVAAHNRPLCNVVNATSAVIGHYLWSVRVQTNGWHERQIVSYVLFNYWPQKTFRKSFFHLRKRRNRGCEKSSWDLEKYLNLTKSSNNPTLRRTFLFLFLWLLLFWSMYKQIDPTLLCVSGVWLYLNQPTLSQSSIAQHSSTKYTGGQYKPCFVLDKYIYQQKSNTGEQFCSLKGGNWLLLTSSASVKLGSHRYVSVPSPWMDTHKAASKSGDERVAYNGILVAVTWEILKNRSENSWQNIIKIIVKALS